MNSSRVVMISGNYPPAVCGIGDYTSRLSTELRALNYSTTVWTRRQHGLTESPTLKMPLIKFDADGMKEVLQRLEEEKPGLIHLQYEVDSFDQNANMWQFVTKAKGIGASLVTTMHALDGPKSWGKMHRMALLPLLYGSRDIIVCSQRQYDGLKKMGGVGNKTQLIPVGTSVPVTGVRTSRPENAPTRFIYFGFVWRGRNIELCLRAFAAASSTRPATLTVVGGVKDTAYQQELNALARSLGVADKVTFAGELPAEAVSQHLIDSDIALLPFATGVSTGRTTFVAAIEHRLPTVTMAVPENLIPEFRNNGNMVYVSPEDEDGFILEAVRLVEDKEQRDRIAANTASLASYFSWKEIARKVAALPSYRSLKSL